MSAHEKQRVAGSAVSQLQAAIARFAQRCSSPDALAGLADRVQVVVVRLQRQQLAVGPPEPELGLAMEAAGVLEEDELAAALAGEGPHPASLAAARGRLASGRREG